MIRRSLRALDERSAGATGLLFTRLTGQSMPRVAELGGQFQKANLSELRLGDRALGRNKLCPPEVICKLVHAPA